MLNEVFSDHFAQRVNYLTEVDTRAKMLFVAAAIMIVVCSSNAYVPLIVSCLCFILLLCIRIPSKIILLRLAFPLGLAAALLLLQVFFYGVSQGLERGCLMMARVLGAVSLIIFLSMTTSVNKLLNTARWFKVPNTWVEIAMLSYRYSFVLLEDALTISNTQKVRLGYSSLGRSLKSFGELMGSAVIRAYDRSLAIYESMLLRGYNGSLQSISWEKDMRIKDVLAIIVFIIILASLLILNSLFL